MEFPQLHLPVIKHLFQQKLFQLCMKSLWHKLETFSEKHLNAFVYVLKMTPHQVLVNNIQKIGPILLQCLALQRAKAVIVALEICKRFVIAKDEYFRDHLQNLVPQCIKLSTNTNSMVHAWTVTQLNSKSNIHFNLVSGYSDCCHKHSIERQCVSSIHDFTVLSRCTARSVACVGR